MTKPGPESSFDLHMVRSFLDPATCREWIVEMRRSPAAAALTYGQDATGAVNERVRKVERITPSAETLKHVTLRLTEYREKASEHFGVNLTGCEEPQFLRYRVGDFFVAHQDGNTGLIALDTDRSRRISVTIFLNRQTESPELDTYCGGSLVFSDWRNDRRFALAGEAGTLVGFRSETTHEVLPVTHGERFAIVSWLGLDAAARQLEGA